MPNMKKLIILFLALCFCCCKPQHQVIVEHKYEYHTVDSTVWHTDTTYFQVPVEVYADYTSLLDTLVLQTNYASSWAAVDTINMLLVGEIKNKNFQVTIEYRWKERIIKNDSIVEVEKLVPYEVEVVKTKIPTWAWLCLAWVVLCVGLVAWRLYRRFFI